MGLFLAVSSPCLELKTVPRGTWDGGGDGTREEVNTSFSFNTLINALPDKQLSLSLSRALSRCRNLISFIPLQSLPSSPLLSPQPHKYRLLGRKQSVKTDELRENTTYTASSEQSTTVPLRAQCLLSFMSVRGARVCVFTRRAACERQREMERKSIWFSASGVYSTDPQEQRRHDLSNYSTDTLLRG